VENLLPATRYYFKIEAFNDAGSSGFSNTVDVETDLAVTVPAAPGNVTLMNVTEGSARLAWIDVADNEAAYEVGTCSGLTRVSGDGLYQCLSGFTAQASLPANSTGYTFTGLSPSTSYLYYVRAVNATGVSDAYGRAFTTLSAVTTVDFFPMVLDGWTYSNVMMHWSWDSSLANTAYPNSYPQVGCNWTYDYDVITGGYFQNFVCGRSAFDFYLAELVGKTILSATLTLEADMVPLDTSRQYRLRPISSAWHPSTLTWNTSLNVYVSEIVFDPPLYVGQELVFDVTTTVQNWADGSLNSYGFLLDMPNLNFPYDTRYQVSQFNWPKLTVTYQ
jgi:hypothetical protein